MKLSKESINYMLDLPKSNLPRMYCHSSSQRLENVRRIITTCYRQITCESSEKKDDFSLSNSVLIFLEDMNKEDIVYLDEKLLVLNNKMAVLLEAEGIKLDIYKRNLILGFLNKNNVNIIKGSKEEIESLIRIYENNSEVKKDYKDRCRYFCRKNDTIVIVEDSCRYITDGYSEFFIKNNSIGDKETYDKVLNTIYSTILACGISGCKNKGEIIQSILISTLVFEVSKKLLLKDMNSNIKYNDKELLEYILNRISIVTSEDIQESEIIYYSFKRN